MILQRPPRASDSDVPTSASPSSLFLRRHAASVLCIVHHAPPAIRPPRCFSSQGWRCRRIQRVEDAIGGETTYLGGSGKPVSELVVKSESRERYGVGRELHGARTLAPSISGQATIRPRGIPTHLRSPIFAAYRFDGTCTAGDETGDVTRPLHLPFALPYILVTNEERAWGSP
jgi:hypothetical protein